MTESARILKRNPVLWGGVGVLVGFLLLLVLGGRGEGAASFHGTPYAPPEPAPEFSLISHTETPLRLTDLRGEVVLLFFGYANCPDVCPLTLSRLQGVLDSLGADAQRVRVLLVTVDPERDTPDALAAYVRNFGPRVTGLTGDPQQIQQTQAQYGVAAAPAPAGHGSHSPELMHTDAIYGIDRAGNLRVLMHPDAPEKELRDDIRTLLAL